jgi:hypothetical protein
LPEGVTGPTVLDAPTGGAGAGDDDGPPWALALTALAAAIAVGMAALTVRLRRGQPIP